MMKFKFPFLKILGVFISFVPSLFAQNEAVYFSIYPVEATVRYGADNDAMQLKFKIVNNDQSDPNNPKILSGFALTNANGNLLPVIVRGDKSCPNMILPAKNNQGSCKFFVEFNTSGNNLERGINLPDEMLSLRFEYTSSNKTQTVSSPAFLLKRATGNEISTHSRTLNIKNNCSHPVWLGVAPYQAKSHRYDKDNPTSNRHQCYNNQDCFPGSACVVIRKPGQNGAHDPGLNQCFWNAPAPAANQYLLAPLSGSAAISIPFFDNGTETIWEGAIAARTECDKGSCTTGECGSNLRGKSGVGCEMGKHFALPSSFAKLVFRGHNEVVYNNTPNRNSAKDSYAVSLANGVHIPVSIEPLSPRSAGMNRPYECNMAGGRNNNYPLGACSWDFSPPTNDYRWVSYQGNQTILCESDRDCTQPNRCGLSFNPAAKSGKQINKTCGEPLGYWTPHALCATDPLFHSALFDCRGLTHDGRALSELFSCAKGKLRQSCYKNNAHDACCGCVNWDTVAGVKVPPHPLTKSCENGNSNWTLHSQPKLVWLKAACPTASVYPHDIASSTFNCQNLNGENINTSHYNLTFCP